MIKLKKLLPASLFFILSILIGISSCKDDGTGDIQFVYEYTVPEQVDDGWETAPLSDVGLNETPLDQFMNEMLNGLDHKIHGILTIKDGILVFEEYFPGFRFYHGPFTNYTRQTRHDLASVTKSFTSTLIGIAIDMGYILDTDQKLFSFFPEYAEPGNVQKDKITLEHLLTMSPGLEWDESSYAYTDPRNDIYQLHHQEDPIGYILGKPMVSDPGAQFHYSGGSTNLLGEIIRKATGKRADEFALQYLFEPLMIRDYQWTELPNDILYTSGDLKLIPRDMAKLGDLFLHGGKWKDEQIISEAWVSRSVLPLIRADEYWEYGYQWWMSTYDFSSQTFGFYAARGWGGQNIMVFPQLEMVVVTTAGYYDEPQNEFHINVLLMQKILESTL